MTKRKIDRNEKDQCRCVAFCLEDTERTGRYCKLKYSIPPKKKTAEPTSQQIGEDHHG